MQQPNIIPVKCKKMIVCEDEFKILRPGEQENLHIFNYRVPQLKAMCRHYGVVVFGANKETLTTRLFSCLESHKSAVVIQKKFRSFMLRRYIKAKGPAFIKRRLCVNDTDFFTMDLVSDIEFEQFISFTDKDSMVYGFDILSLHNLLTKGTKPSRNPYNRNELPKTVLDNMEFLFKFSHIYFKKIDVRIDEPILLDKTKHLELNCITLFQEINNLGNYADHLWLWSLGKNKLVKFIKELADIWSYRANLSIEMKRTICPPNGDPGLGLNVYYYVHSMDLNKLRKTCMSIIQSMILSATDETNRVLGANYVLCALTLVNDNASASLPWLYQSVSQY